VLSGLFAVAPAFVLDLNSMRCDHEGLSNRYLARWFTALRLETVALQRLKQFLKPPESNRGSVCTLNENHAPTVAGKAPYEVFFCFRLCLRLILQ
jgi:hypothetical protein